MTKSKFLRQVFFAAAAVSFLNFAMPSQGEARIFSSDDEANYYTRENEPSPEPAYVAPPPPPVVVQTSSEEQFVRELYRQELRREGDDGGIQFWTAYLQSGASRDSLSAHFRWVCQAHINGECPEAPPVQPTTYTCTLRQGNGYNCFRINYQTTGLYSCSNGANIAVFSSNYSCSGSVTMTTVPSQNGVYTLMPNGQLQQR